MNLPFTTNAGDIAFRFINYVRSQREHQVRQKLRTHQNLSWQEITKLYQEEEHKSLGGSHVVVCDINKEMLKVGKQKSQRLGYSEGNRLLQWGLNNSRPCVCIIMCLDPMKCAPVSCGGRPFPSFSFLQLSPKTSEKPEDHRSLLDKMQQGVGTHSEEGECSKLTPPFCTSRQLAPIH